MWEGVREGKLLRVRTVKVEEVKSEAILEAQSSFQEDETEVPGAVERR